MTNDLTLDVQYIAVSVACNRNISQMMLDVRYNPLRVAWKRENKQKDQYHDALSQSTNLRPRWTDQDDMPVANLPDLLLSKQRSLPVNLPELLVHGRSKELRKHFVS